METYWRLLRFASPIGRYALPYLLLTLFAVVFTTLNLALLAPLLSTLFAETSPEEHLSRPEHWYALMDQFAYYSARLKAEHGAYAALQFICIGLVLSVLLSNLFRYGSERIMENLRIHMLVRMRKAIYTHVLALPLPYLNTQRKGDILARLASDVQVVQYAVTGTLQVLFKEPFQLLAYLVVLFALSYKLTLFSLLVLPVAAFVIAQIVKKLKAQATAAQESYSRMISLIDETLSAIKIIRGHQAAERMEAAFEHENQHFARLGRKMAKRQQLSSPVSEFLGVCMVALLVLYGGNLVIQENSELSAAEFITYIAVFSQLMRPAKAISSSFSTIHSGLAAGERVLQLLDTPTVTAEEEEVPFRLQRFEREIHFDQVYFAYGKPVLKGIQLRIRKGQTVALVGPSGGGKSTLMDLIPRFISAKSGKIYIDGLPLDKIQAASLRAHIGIVNQDSFLFHASVRDNIAFGKPDASQEEIEAAAKIAHAHLFISQLVDGYATPVGDRGVQLSGGQRQRICIARAILSNPSILLLDEATSALDTESERLVQNALDHLMHNRTTLVIAHRLSTIQRADLIVVLDQGRIVAQGTHESLLAEDGLYSRLIEMQQFTPY